jgi:hypothetical protein
MSAAFSSGALAFRLVGTDAANLLSALVAFLNIGIAFSTMTDVSRSKIRNEEHRIQFYDEELTSIKKALFGLMGRSLRNTVPESQAPFLTELDQKINHFQRSAIYYGEKASPELKRAFKQLKKNIVPMEIIKFQKLLTSELIVDKYHVNSYLQEDLVKIYKSLDETLSVLSQTFEKNLSNADAKTLFDNLHAFTPRLDQSLQRGPIRWGFIKRRKLLHWDIVVVLRYFYSFLCCCPGFRRRLSSWAPIEKQTYDILQEMKDLSASCNHSILRREIRDMEELFWATHESDIASMIFVSSSLTLAASVLFTISRIFNINQLERIAFWATAPSILGAFLATFHFVRKLRILGNLWIILGYKVQAARKVQDRLNIQKVRRVTMTQILLTLLRLGAAAAASVALPFSLADNAFGYTPFEREKQIPFWIAFSAVIVAIIATILFFIVEYVVRYNLSPKLPVSVVESFRDEVNAIYWIMHKEWNDIDTKHVQETITWEYVAREFLHKYRFDTVFAADRFGSIFHYIQSGMEPEIPWSGQQPKEQP